MTQLACIQMASGPNVSANLEEAGRLVEMAVEAGAQMTVLPEYFALMGSDKDKLKAAEHAGSGPIQDFLAGVAQRTGAWLVGGAIPLKTADPARIRSSVLLYNPDGAVVARYDKIHLFDVTLPQSEESYNESKLIEPGDEVVVVDTPLGKLGLCVCYDIRFPEMFRQQLDRGMEILAMPSAFTAVTGKAHWQPLLQARAIENQCYLAAADQGGYHVNGRETHGHSMIVDPWGGILDCLPSGAGYVIADIDRGRLEAMRQHFPSIAHRRLS